MALVNPSSKTMLAMMNEEEKARARAMMKKAVEAGVDAAIAKTTASELDHYRTDPAPTEASKQEETDLDRYYRTQQQLLDQGKEMSLQNADIAYQTAKKYLPIQNKQNGMNGLGVSESALIDVYNKNAQAKGAIAQRHSADTADLLANYHADRKTEQDQIYQEAMTMLQSGAYNSSDDIDRYLEGVRGRVSDTQMGQLDYMANYIKNNPDQQEVWKTAAEQEKGAIVSSMGVKNRGKKSMENGDNFVIQTGNGELGLESRGEVTDSAIVTVAAGIPDQRVFGFNNQLYVKMGGKIYAVGARNGKATSDDYETLYQHFYK